MTWYPLFAASSIDLAHHILVVLDAEAIATRATHHEYPTFSFRGVQQRHEGTSIQARGRLCSKGASQILENQEQAGANSSRRPGPCNIWT